MCDISKDATPLKTRFTKSQLPKHYFRHYDQFHFKLSSDQIQVAKKVIEEKTIWNFMTHQQKVPRYVIDEVVDRGGSIIGVCYNILSMYKWDNRLSKRYLHFSDEYIDNWYLSFFMQKDCPWGESIK